MSLGKFVATIERHDNGWVVEYAGGLYAGDKSSCVCSSLAEVLAAIIDGDEEARRLRRVGEPALEFFARNKHAKAGYMTARPIPVDDEEA